MAMRIIRPLALIKLTSSSKLPGAEKPLTMEHIAPRLASEAATPRRQKARVRGYTVGGKACKSVRMVRPEKTVSSTTAREGTESSGGNCCPKGIPLVVTTL